MDSATIGSVSVEFLGHRRTIIGRDGEAIELGPIRAGQVDELRAQFAQVVAAGEGYPQVPPLTRAAFEDVWVIPVTITVAATVEGELAGAYYLKPNQPGLGAHIANAGYVVGAAYRGRGYGRNLIADSIERAPLAGFDAIQFNFVFESNPARATYERMGWTVVGRIPNAVPDPAGGRQAALIYWQAVGGIDKNRDGENS